MAVGDDAQQAGYPLVQPSDMVEQGYVELNRTRDFIAQVLLSIPAIWPISRGGTGASDGPTGLFNMGISVGTNPPDDSMFDNPVDGDIYLRINGLS
jgi:hypothetical protein